MKIRKYTGTIRVTLPHDRGPDDSSVPSTNRELGGYYRSISVYAPSEGHAVHALDNSVVDGRIDWSKSDLAEVKRDTLDWIRILAGRRVVQESGRAFFPFEDPEETNSGESSVGWLMKK